MGMPDCWTLCKWSCAELLKTPLLTPHPHPIAFATLYPQHCNDFWETSSQKKTKDYISHAALQTNFVKLWMLLLFSNLMTMSLSYRTGTNWNWGTYLCTYAYMFKRRDLIISRNRPKLKKKDLHITYVMIFVMSVLPDNGFWLAGHGSDFQSK